MSRHVGVMRSESGLRSCLEALAELSSEVSVGTTASRRSWEATNLLTVATAVVVAALARTESRGCHRRSDWPAPRDEWRRHLGVYLDGSGLHLDGIPGAAPAPGSERV
jgi:L-aspartate oxidase